MNCLSKVFWDWNLGSVTTELVYKDKTEKKFYLSDPPPTTPAHDISHFICGFHNDLEWDFSLNPNHIAEYNAVFLEHLLLLFYNYPDLDDDNFKIQIEGVYEYMRWFCEDYYRIPTELHKKYSADYLKKRFLEKVNPLTVAKFYDDYYSATYLVEELNLLQNTIKIQLTLDETSAKVNEKCYSFIERVKNLGN